MGKSKLGMLVYSLVLIVISAVITTFVVKYFVVGYSSSETAQNEIKPITEVSAEKVASSPLTSDRDVIEIFSYGCHFCATYDADVTKLEQRLPTGSRLLRLHLNTPRNGLARFAPVFATLSVMGLEDQYREKAYYAVLMKKIDLTNDAELDAWLQSNQIDVVAYHKTRESQDVAKLLDYMQAVSTHYEIKATPMFIVGKKWVLAKDKPMDEFSDQIIDLLKKEQ